MPNAIQIVFLILACVFLIVSLVYFGKTLKRLIVAKRNKKKALEDNKQEVKE